MAQIHTGCPPLKLRAWVLFLDANYLIENTKAGRAAAQWVDDGLRSREPLYVSALAWAEYLGGPLTPREEMSSLARLIDFSPLDAEAATRVGPCSFKTPLTVEYLHI